MHLAYIATMCVVCSLAMLGSGPMVRTSLAILLNWIAQTVFAETTGIYDAWWFFIVIDAITAAVIIRQPAAKVQALIACVFMGQILLHVVYAFSNHSVGAYPYWQLLTVMAFLQLLLLGGWTIDRGRRHLWKRRNPRLAGAASTTGLGAW